MQHRNAIRLKGPDGVERAAQAVYVKLIANTPDRFEHGDDPSSAIERLSSTWPAFLTVRGNPDGGS
jgi:hypothetical protein